MPLASPKVFFLSTRWTPAPISTSTGISGQINFPWGMWDGWSVSVAPAPVSTSTGISGQINFPWGMWDGWSVVTATSTGAAAIRGREDATWFVSRPVIII